MVPRRALPLERLYVFPPGRGPEWGSGGIYGLRYHKDALLFTLAFEAEVHIYNYDVDMTYAFDHVGDPPRSGGDTYDAATTVDGQIFFGGWVHAPYAYARTGPYRGRVSFRNKYSHVHVYDVYRDEVRLVWAEGLGDEERWAGEVSEILYNPVDNALLVARGDGHAGLGVYRVDLEGRAERLMERRVLKGTTLSDMACFNVLNDGLEAVELACMDMHDGRWLSYPLPSSAVDGHPIAAPRAGPLATTHNRALAFMRGGVAVLGPHGAYTVRLMDFGRARYGPIRTRAIPLAGGVLAPFNAAPEASLADPSPPGPTALAFIAPPMVRLVAAFGARVTSGDAAGPHVLLATNTASNLEGDEACYMDNGYRSIVAVGQWELLNGVARAHFVVRGSDVGDAAWGGIPVAGQRRAVLVARLTRDNVLETYEYSLSPDEAARDRHRLPAGRTVIDLKAYSGIVSFRLTELDPGAVMEIALE